MLSSKTMIWQYKPDRLRSLLLISLLVLLSLQTFSQPNKRTNFWYFGENAGLDFNSGQPIITNYGQFFENINGGASICDTAGNLLFYTDGKQIWDRDHNQMKNGFVDFHPGTQAAVIVPLPGSDNIYYVFTSQSNAYQYQFFYYIVDMNLANGLGEVVETVTLQEGWDAAEKLTAVYHKNKQDIWVITRKFIDDNYAAFLVTSDGVNPTPVLSPAPDKDLNNNTNTIGCMKVSYDKKYLITSFFGGSSIEEMDNEICSFNNETGQVDFLYSFSLHIVIPTGPSGYRTFGFDFSPDSKYLYLPGIVQVDAISHVFQFNMQYIEDSLLFFQSAIEVGIGQGMSLQLASDGKIYCSTKYIAPPSQFMGVIHKPWREGIDCEYEPNSINLLDKIVTASLPNFLTDYLFRFDFDGICESDTFSFDPWFFPEPVFIEWDFGDPASGTNNTSTIPHATHKFTNGGTYEVTVHVVYPNGRIEETSREVEVGYTPEPDLGPDTTICSSQEILLDAECGTHSYLWSTNQFATSHIIVSDTGWYWVKVTSDEGCYAYDSIYISNYAPAIADTTNLIISPTTCGGSTGVIRELSIIGTPPFSYQWLDDLGNPIATTIDLYHLPVGNYTLQVVDSNNCTTNLGPYSIFDAGNVLVNSVSFTDEHCEQSDASIIVTATSGLGDMLKYSIHNGNPGTYVYNNGVFTGLAAGSYAVRVEDSTGCIGSYINNPIIINNIQGPLITDAQTTPATVGQNNGSFNIIASGSGDTIFYSNDDSVSFQINDGFFTNLYAGYYTCVVVDEFGCDTTFVVEITEVITVELLAVAGADEVCPGNSTFVPLSVSNFNDVASFSTTLLYSKELITCTGFSNAHPQLEDSLEALLFPAEGKIELNWASSPVTLPANTNIVELKFQSIDPGTSLVDWNGSTGPGSFLNSTGIAIPVVYNQGNVKIYNEVGFFMFGTNEVCEGDQLNITPLVSSHNGDVTYLWTYPNGSTNTDQTLEIIDIQLNQSGEYKIIVTDTANCNSSDSVTVTVFPTPAPVFALQDTIFTDYPFDLDAGLGYLHYLWNTGDTTQYIWVEDEDWYMAEVESFEGCRGEDSTFVVFSTPPTLIKIYFPNAFTPNGDGQNDMFNVVTSIIDINQFSLSIYNRWGVMMHHTKDITNGWDGTYQGELCPSGAYVYKVSYNSSTSLNSAPEIKMGTVMLVR